MYFYISAVKQTINTNIRQLQDTIKKFMIRNYGKNSALILLAFFIGTTQLSAQNSEESLFQNVKTSFVYTADIHSNIAGGSETGTRYLDNIDVNVSFDIEDFSFFVYGLGNQGRSISALSGDIQTLSNIEAENSWRLYEAWVQRSFKEINSSLLVGLYDLNSEFDVINTGQLFLNSSHGIGPDFSSSGITGPSIFPLTSLSVRLKVNPTPGLIFKVAILDGIPSEPGNTRGTTVKLGDGEGALLVSELSITKPSLKRGVVAGSPYRIALGAWKYTQERTGWQGEQQSDHGFYVLAEAEFNESLSGFTRFGMTNHKINRFHSYIGAGINYLGLLENRPLDKIGVAFALPLNSTSFKDVQESFGNDYSESELNVELTYLTKISKHFSFQLDTQYIKNPNLSPDIDDALVLGVRSVLSF